LFAKRLGGSLGTSASEGIFKLATSVPWWINFSGGQQNIQNKYSYL
jgi:hypothetical protein